MIERSLRLRRTIGGILFIMGGLFAAYVGADVSRSEHVVLAFAIFSSPLSAVVIYRLRGLTTQRRAEQQFADQSREIRELVLFAAMSIAYLVLFLILPEAYLGLLAGPVVGILVGLGLKLLLVGRHVESELQD
ncbi:MAG: hypothetical protein ACRD02_05010 [Acidimicrobiia bacterium]